MTLSTRAFLATLPAAQIDTPDPGGLDRARALLPEAFARASDHAELVRLLSGVVETGQPQLAQDALSAVKLRAGQAPFPAMGYVIPLAWHGAPCAPAGRLLGLINTDPFFQDQPEGWRILDTISMAGFLMVPQRQSTAFNNAYLSMLLIDEAWESPNPKLVAGVVRGRMRRKAPISPSVWNAVDARLRKVAFLMDILTEEFDENPSYFLLSWIIHHQSPGEALRLLLMRPHLFPNKKPSAHALMDRLMAMPSPDVLDGRSPHQVKDLCPDLF